MIEEIIKTVAKLPGVENSCIDKINNFRNTNNATKLEIAENLIIKDKIMEKSLLVIRDVIYEDQTKIKELEEKIENYENNSDKEFIDNFKKSSLGCTSSLSPSDIEKNTLVLKRLEKQLRKTQLYIES